MKGGAKLADLAATAGDSANYVFSKTESFTEFSAPRSFRNPSLTFCEVREEGVAEGDSETQNKGIIAPGYHFYDAVYDQEVDGVAVVRNQPEDRVFVIQVTEKDSDDSVLEKTSGVENDYLTQEAVRTIRLLKNAQFQEDWIDQLKKNAGFEWVVVPGEIQSR